MNNNKSPVQCAQCGKITYETTVTVGNEGKKFCKDCTIENSFKAIAAMVEWLEASYNFCNLSENELKILDIAGQII